jgi:hypothetical protein
MCITGTRSACINAATLALADAGIPMRDIVTSCSAGYLCSKPLLGKTPNYFFHIFDKIRIVWYKQNSK